MLSETRVGRSAVQLSRRFLHRLQGRKPDVPGLPAPDREHVVTSRDGVDLWVNDLGSQDADVVCVFAHGFTLTSNSWFFQAEYLRREWPEVRLLIPDLRGHGRSPVVRGEEVAPLSVDDTARDLLDVMSELIPENARIVLIGHSMGVMSVLGVIRMMSDAERERLAGLMLINGAIDTFASRGITRILDSAPVRLLRLIGKQTPSWAHQAKSGMEWLIKPVIAGLVYHGALEEGDSAKFDIVEFHTREIDSTSMGTILGYLDGLATHDETKAAPYLRSLSGAVMVGKKDDVTPAEQTRVIGRLWPKSRVVECEDAGHMLPVECPEAVNSVLADILREA